MAPLPGSIRIHALEKSRNSNPMTMMTGSLARKCAMILGAALARTALTDSANAYWRGGCWGCGAFAAGAIAGAVVTRPYYPPVYYSPPVVVAPAPVYTAPAVVYPTCPAFPPYPSRTHRRPRCHFLRRTETEVREKAAELGLVLPD